MRWASSSETATVTVALIAFGLASGSIGPGSHLDVLGDDGGAGLATQVLVEDCDDVDVVTGGDEATSGRGGGDRAAALGHELGEAAAEDFLGDVVGQDLLTGRDVVGREQVGGIADGAQCARVRRGRGLRPGAARFASRIWRARDRS